ncbi:MAG: serine/threonine-protein kinase [Gammaproteobacteria bacterium]
MSDFREALYAHLDGKTSLEEVQLSLRASLAGQSTLAPAHGAVIEALYRGDRLSGDTYLVLMKCVHAIQQPVPQPPPPEGDDKTIFRAVSAPRAAPGDMPPPPADDPDKTRLRARSSHAAASPPPSRPAFEGSSSEAAASTTPPSHNPTLPTATSTSWSDPSRWTGTDAPPPAPGTVIRDRFVLEEQIGKGGMGTVFKARDLRKEEAQDRNPYVAIKILNEDFKRHPQSLQALQREARKSQTLAHPNIVTVYDFDRDGANVYMVMELLEGEPLDRVIRRNEGTGVGLQEALRIAREICTGMSYAHANGFVHADFKPANTYLLRDGVVKVLDFGIARAVKSGVLSAGELTVFDPGTLGALTPAYASCEVIAGREPDTRDDVYAIACVIYELITGTHPFKRMSSDLARSMNAVVERPAGLPGRIWRALRQALDFNREQRPASATVLLEAFIVQPYPQVLQATGIAAAIVVVVIAGVLIRNAVLTHHERSVAATLASADGAGVEALLPELRALPTQQRAAILLDGAARSGLILFFEGRMNDAVDGQKGRHDYPQAEALLAELKTFLSDSQAVKDIGDRLNARKNDEIKRQSDWLDFYLKRGMLISAQGAPNVSTVLEIVRAVDPGSRLLSDPRLPGAFAQQAGVALESGDVRLAQALVTAGLAIDSRDPGLVDLRDRVRLARVTAAARPEPTAANSLSKAAAAAEPPTDRESLEAQSEAVLLARLGAAFKQPILSLGEARRMAWVVEELGRRGYSAAPDLKKKLKIQLVGDVNAIRARSGIDAAIRFAEGAYALFPDSPGLKKTLIEVRLAAAQRAAQRRDGALAEIRHNLDGLLDTRSVEDTWSLELEGEMRRLSGYLPDDDPYVTHVRRTAAGLYLTRANALADVQRLAEGARMLDRAHELGADPAAMAQTEKLLAGAKAKRELDIKARDSAAQIAARKEKLLVQAKANDVTGALASLEALRPDLAKKDLFLVEEGPNAIGRAFLRMASGAARDGRFEDAVRLAERGRQIARSLPEIGQARERYIHFQAIDGTLTHRSGFDVRGIRRELAALAKQDPEETTAVMRRFVRNLLTRVDATSEPITVARLSQAARELNEDATALGGPDAAAATAR